MAGSGIIDGQARKAIVSQVGLSTTGSAHDFGVFDTGLYARFAGIISCVGSATLQYRMGVDSGAFQVTSSIAVNSTAGTTFDVLNYGHRTSFRLNPINSQSAVAILIYGESIR